MILQKILFPTVGICTTEELYYRASSLTNIKDLDFNYNEKNIIFNMNIIKLKEKC